MKKKNWYQLENNKVVIEISVTSLRQLFDERDPTPFKERDLDDDAVEYIVSSAQEVSPRKVGKIKILTLDAVNETTKNLVQYAVKDNFHYKAHIADKKLRSTLRIGVKTLLIGLLFLSCAVLASNYLDTVLKESFWGHFFKEGMLLMGWVSMWKPINIFLYEWWPLLDLKKLYIELSEVHVDLVFNEKSGVDFFAIQSQKKA